ncbi:MAG TPA: hypothetical protein CFH82_09845 [Sulfurospirillum sp. UBA12182]|nr:MAG TPA: hypothetical protein CFH82_09845 [Sulfurospirillum sp. UBA12182]
MRVVICGASSLVGTHLTKNLISQKHEIVRIGREHFRDVKYLKNSLEGAHVVINLCGESFFCKWDEPYKHQLYVSRIETTKKLIKAISQCEIKPHTYIAASSTNIYKEELVHNDKSQDFGSNYLALLVKEYERESKKVEELGLRCVIFRYGYILHKTHGILKMIQKAYFWKFGFLLAKGKPLIAWVDMDDVINSLLYTIEHKSINGIYNVVSSEVVNIKKFMKILGKVIKKPLLFSMPNFFFKLLYAEGGENLLKGSFVVSKKLQEDGFIIKNESLEESLKKIYK